MARSGMAAKKGKGAGRGKQDYGTPPEFLRAVEARFGKISWDLAAHEGNAVVPYYYGPGSDFATDSLGPDAEWDFVGGVAAERGECLWLNPPYAKIAPWVAKASKYEGKAPLCMLVPASVSCNWFWYYVWDKALVFPLSPRLTFVGCDEPYPKDLMLCVYTPRPWPGDRLQRWRWA